MVAIQADEHIPYSIVKGLRARGVDIFSMEEEQLKSFPDEQLLEYCRSHGRVLLTNDRDFFILAQQKDHGGIIYLTSQYHSIGEVIRAVLKLIDAHAEEEFIKAIFYVP